MNERIKLLAEQCGFKSNPNIYDRNQSFDIPKFAELIVRECAEVGSYGQGFIDSGLIKRAVLQHFGVEE